MEILEKLKTRNEFPILFIGSGISKRYLKDFPSWKDLLKEYWDQIKKEDDFYGYYNIMSNQLKKEQPDLSDKEIDFKSNLKMATLIQEKYNFEFNKGNITLEGFTTQDAHLTKICPFKKSLSMRFSDFEFLPNIKEELDSFTRMLQQALIVITTNYDQLIEKSFSRENSESLDKYIGQKGFFEPNDGFAELFKIHGCIEEPESIVISENDYNYFNENSILITARIISHLIHSPIIFMGYSLTDMNVRNFIKEFAKSAKDTDAIKLEDKLIVIERAKGEVYEEKVIEDAELGCTFTTIKTNNFKKVFDKISEINQGVSPIEIKKYKKTIRNLIVDAGKEGSLKSILVSSTTLDEIQEMINNGNFKNIAIAVGDSRVIFQIPDNVTFMHSYITENINLTTDVALRFLFGQRMNTYLPFKRFMKEDFDNIDSKFVDKLKQRDAKYKDISVILDSIPASNKIPYDNLSEIKKDYYDEFPNKCHDIITFNILKLNLEEIKDFIISELKKLQSNKAMSVDTSLRKLIVAYDLIEHI